MIETNRLIIREMDSSDRDIEALYAILSDVEVNAYLPWYPLKSVDEAKTYFQQRIQPKYDAVDEGYYFAVCKKADNKPIGYIAVSGDESHDFGYGLRKDFWNQGIITEAAAAVIDFLKTKKWSYITATHDRKNPASGAVMKKLGMDYKYSYNEQWQPKDILVTFRMYQMNFDGKERTYQQYWEKYSEHFIEDEVQ
ncbi:GNAT family N-acetyltransferase [Candidatus Enterococcus clewellii]|uniref:N-acetyltransferase domain-containing protein n=1 Tax=Candidatus Enterococcus clewellii TaxID=1834193 RepID=A0A242KCB6_9ENTE|nr:GNAT family N-acetyltransferase [Enterococcus sp. 9E7_DIV0242]OTP18606.1 hypothetical protein A5888_000420 [Enterococcus sp. 9E7_DIV0242]